MADNDDMSTGLQLCHKKLSMVVLPCPVCSMPSSSVLQMAFLPLMTWIDTFDGFWFPFVTSDAMCTANLRKIYLWSTWTTCNHVVRRAGRTFSETKDQTATIVAVFLLTIEIHRCIGGTDRCPPLPLASTSTLTKRLPFMAEAALVAPSCPSTCSTLFCSCNRQSCRDRKANENRPKVGSTRDSASTRSKAGATACLKLVEQIWYKDW